jgi:CubicO group peptidase (beta-lactamase class C family)
MSGDITPAKLNDGWPVAAPEQQGIDAPILSGIGPRFAAWEEACAHAVVVARHGTLVYEHYFTSADWRWNEPLGAVAFDAMVKHDVRSITKSVTSLLVGVALDHGWIADINTPVFTYFPEHGDLRSPEKERITLAHLLTMSAGLAWDERVPWTSAANNERLMDEASDPYRYVLEQPVAAPTLQLLWRCSDTSPVRGAKDIGQGARHARA